MCMEDGNEGCLRLEDGTGLHVREGRISCGCVQYFMYGGKE